MPFRLALLAALLLTACSDQPTAEDRKRIRAERQQAQEEALSRTPDARTYRIEGHELKVIEVPVRDITGHVDIQRCFVWRDQDYRSATLSCGQAPEIMLTN